MALLRPDDLFPVWCLVDSLEQAGEMARGQAGAGSMTYVAEGGEWTPSNLMATLAELSPSGCPDGSRWKE